MYNAARCRRSGGIRQPAGARRLVDLSGIPTLTYIDARCSLVPALAMRRARNIENVVREEPPTIRFCFPKTDDMLIEAGRRLQKLAR